MKKTIFTTVLIIHLAINAQDVKLSMVSTIVADAVTSTSATLNSEITLKKGGVITEKGFVYSLSAKGLIIGGSNVDKAVSDIGIIHRGTDFSSKNIKGLASSKQYFYRVYTTNNEGITSYGTIQSFTTELITNCTHPWGRVIVYPSNGTATFGIVTIDGNNGTSDDLVGVFAGDELRGIGTIVINEGISYMPGTVVNAKGSAELLTFKVFDKSECKAVSVEFTINSNPGERIGEGWVEGRDYLPLKAVNVDTTEPTAPIITTGSIETTDDAVAITGTAEAGSTVTLIKEDTPLTDNTVIVASDGTWSIYVILTDVNNIFTATATDESGNKSSESTPITITYNGVAAGNESLDTIDFIISPNPAVGTLNITITEKAEYRLLNIRGQVLKEGTLASGKKNELNISSLSKGVYFLNLKMTKGSFTKKIIK